MSDSQNFEMHQGNDKSIEVSVVDNDGDAVDVSTATGAQYELAKNQSSVVKVTKTLGAGISVSGSMVTVVLDDTDTEDLAGNYYHELEVIDAAGYIHTALHGWVDIKKTRVAA